MRRRAYRANYASQQTGTWPHRVVMGVNRFGQCLQLTTAAEPHSRPERVFTEICGPGQDTLNHSRAYKEVMSIQYPTDFARASATTLPGGLEQGTWDVAVCVRWLEPQGPGLGDRNPT